MDGDFEDEEIKCTLSFLEKVDDPSIRNLFHVTRLKDAIEASFISTTTEKKKKILLLYFHNSSDEFSKLFCTCLKKPNFQSMLNRSYYLVGWDVENTEFQSALHEALLLTIDLSPLVDLLGAKKGAAILLTPINDIYQIYSVLKWKTNESNILCVLKEAEKVYEEELKCEAEMTNNEEAFTARHYLEYMCNGLGDRDYDSFEHDEHDLLKQKIAYALYGPPKKCENCKKKEQKDSTQMLNSCENCGIYSKKENEVIDKLKEVIVRENDEVSKWKGRVIVAFIYICIEPLPKEKLQKLKTAEKNKQPYDPNSDFIPVPIFVIRKCKNCDNPCRIFIDNIGRVYKSWMDFITSNKLPQCELITPKNGSYNIDENGNVLLEKHVSPACGFDRKLLTVTDISSTVVGLFSGGTLLAAAIPAVTVPPVFFAVAAGTGIAVGAYTVGRSIHTLIDRGRHKEDLSFINAESRGAYLNIVAGSLGFVGFGINMAVTQLASKGFNIGTNIRTTYNIIQVLNLSASGVGVVNSGYEIIDQWRNDGELSTLAILQLSSSLLFFGNAVYNFKSASTIIEETQTNTIRDINESLKSNKHKKMFNKLLKETIRQNENNIIKGQAEVISSIRNIKNTDQLFATLSRSNKFFNKNDIKFSSKNGQICLNGIPIDMKEFTKLNKNDMNTFLTTLPSLTKSNGGGNNEPTPMQINKINRIIQRNLININNKTLLSSIMNLTPQIIRIITTDDQTVQEKLINAFTALLGELHRNKKHYGIMQILDEIFPGHTKYMRILTMVTNYFERLIAEIENKYDLWQRTNNNPIYEEPYFNNFISLDSSKRAIEIFKNISDIYFTCTNNLNEQGLLNLIRYFYTWIAKQIEALQDDAERKERRSAYTKEPKEKIECKLCGGVYYNKSTK